MRTSAFGTSSCWRRPSISARWVQWLLQSARDAWTPTSLLDETGNVPADALYSGFYMQAPTKEIAGYATLLENLWNNEFVDAYQSMAQWSRDHVPMPGALTRQMIDDLIRRNVLMTGGWELGGRMIELDKAPGNILNAVAEKDNVVPFAAVAPVMDLDWGAQEEGADAPHGWTRDLWRRESRIQANGSRAVALDLGAQRRARPTQGEIMEIRQLEQRDREGLEQFIARVPEGDRTFFKENVDDPEVRESWLRLGAARAVAIEGERVLGYMAVVPLQGWSSHVGEVRVIVDPDARGRGIGRALAQHAVLEALRLGLTKMVVEVVADQEATIAMFRSLGFDPEALLADHVRDQAGDLRDLMILAHSVEESWASMNASGIAGSL